MADFFIAISIKLIASFTCSQTTYSAYCIFAKASDSRIRDSSYRGVAVIVLDEFPLLRI